VVARLLLLSPLLLLLLGDVGGGGATSLRLLALPAAVLHTSLCVASVLALLPVHGAGWMADVMPVFGSLLRSVVGVATSIPQSQTWLWSPAAASRASVSCFAVSRWHCARSWLALLAVQLPFGVVVRYLRRHVSASSAPRQLQLLLPLLVLAMVFGTPSGTAAAAAVTVVEAFAVTQHARMLRRKAQAAV
jgi:hypothetical protein